VQYLNHMSSNVTNDCVLKALAMGHYYDVLQLEAEEEEIWQIFPLHIPALTHQTGSDLLRPQTLSLKGQAAFRLATMELEGSMEWVHLALQNGGAATRQNVC